MAYNIVPHGLFAVALAKLRRVPVYLHFIGGEAEINFADNVLVSDNRLINRTRNPHRLEGVARRVALCADKIFVPGHNTEEYLLANGFNPAAILKLHSTIDPDRFFPSDQERDIDILVAAQIRERKQPLFVLEIFREILNIRPETKFCWLGDGALHDEFSATLDRLQLRDSVTWIETNEVAEYYRRSKVFLLCSLREGLSLASMEAMRCGMPVIASDCGDMSDTVLTGETGQLMPKNATKDQYVDAVMGYLNNPAELERQSKNAFDIIDKEHTFPIAIDIWKEILDTFV
jgi:glycosyltransferase involved in cell wall biosynthesis